MGKCQARRLNLNKFSCKQEAGKHWFCSSHRNYPVYILAGFFLAVVWPTLHQIAMALYGPETSGEKEILQEVKSEKTTKQITEEQYAQLKELNAIFGKSDWDLRQDAGVWDMLSKNIEVEKRFIELSREGRKDEFKYNDYTEGDHSFLMVVTQEDLDRGKIKNTLQGVQVDNGPRDVMFLITNTKYQEYQKLLIKYINSSLVPSEIKKKIIDYKVVWDNDVQLIATTITKWAKQNDNYVLENTKEGSTFKNVINDDYAKKFISLKPPAESVISEISQYLIEK